MNLQAMTAGMVGLVNPPVPCSWSKSSGYTTAGSGKQQPTYKPPVTISGQVQALSGKDLKALDGLNIQGVMRGLYAQGDIQGVNDPRQQGGDLITFANNKTVPADLRNTKHLVVQVLETWSGGWCKVAMVQQL